ncbi:hypothetical protein ABID22_003808 [Pontibacter aydingkolensis]|uniref:Periplasmic protein n=1 Tax=Pontibacter aydingkolensis TaxID=1911536 RepID=A0ABS7CZ22_9BACT|nr:hypothetical protein [Pontibacter aydingkolensis]MBW7469098.1 hypothetical protein [Pontibacter aydingkolensis]
MKKVILALAVVGLLGSAAPAMACEGGKCTMEHATKKSKKGKKAAAKDESCHMTKEATASTGATPAKSCCVKPDAAKADATKEVKKAQ